MKSNSEWQF